jgi:hypothetical protein
MIEELDDQDEATLVNANETEEEVQGECPAFDDDLRQRQRNSQSAEWSESEGLLMFRGKIYVLKDRELRRRIVEQHHNTRVAGHAGCFKTLKIISQNYWWPQMPRYIGVYVKTCNLCNRTKLQHCRPSGELHPTETPEEQ